MDNADLIIGGLIFLACLFLLMAVLTAITGG